MEITDQGELLGRIEQIEQGDGDSGQLVAQSQAGEPEGRKRTTSDYKGLYYQQRFWVRPEQIEERYREENRLKVNSKTRNTIYTIAVSIMNNITDCLM